MRDISNFSLLDIKGDCFDMLIASFTAWLKGEYRFLFTESLGFRFNKEGHTLGDKIIIAKGDIVDIAIRNGMIIKINKASTVSQEALLSMVDTYSPIILEIDGHDCPWRNTFQKIHRLHYILLLKYDTHANTFSCIDTFPTNNDLTISLDFMLKRAKRFIVLLTDDKKVIRLKHKDYFLTTIERYSNKDVIGSYFDHLNLFIESFGNTIDLQKETKGLDAIEMIHVPLIWKLKNYVWSFSQYQYLLEYINEKDFGELKNILQKIINCWEIVISILAMKIIRKDTLVYTEKIQEYIKKAVKDEELFIERLSTYF
jgi:hypothetical protein